MPRALIVTLGLVGLVACLVIANFRRDGAAFELDWKVIPTPPREVTLESPTRGPVVETITAPGEVELIEEAEIASQIVGRVVAVEVKEGDRVEAGDVLVRLDDTNARARLQSVEARIQFLQGSIRQADTDREKSQRDLSRLVQLSGRGAVTPTEVADARSISDKADAALMMSRNELSESEAMRRTSLQELEYTVIHAPMAGVVMNLDVEVGEVVIAGTTNLPGTVLMSVGDPTRLRVRADVDETDVPLVREGQPARVYLQADPSNPIPGTVELVAPKGKSGTDSVISFETLIRVETDVQAMKPAMSSTVEVEVRRADDVLGVPVQAVVHRRRKDLPDTSAVRSWVERNSGGPGAKVRDAEARYVKIVFVVENGIARARPVETGLSDERRVEILSGLGPDERVITGPFRTLDELKDGDAVVEEVAELDELAATTTAENPK